MYFFIFTEFYRRWYKGRFAFKYKKKLLIILWINVREYRRDNQKWITQRNWHHRVHKTTINKQNNNNTICVTPLYTNKYTIHKQIHYTQTNTLYTNKYTMHKQIHYTQTNTNNVNKTFFYKHMSSICSFTKDIGCFSAKHATLMRRKKSSLTRN